MQIFIDILNYIKVYCFDNVLVTYCKNKFKYVTLGIISLIEKTISNQIIKNSIEKVFVLSFLIITLQLKGMSKQNSTKKISYKIVPKQKKLVTDRLKYIKE